MFHKFSSSIFRQMQYLASRTGQQKRTLDTKDNNVQSKKHRLEGEEIRKQVYTAPDIVMVKFINIIASSRFSNIVQPLLIQHQACRV